MLQTGGDMMAAVADVHGHGALGEVSILSSHIILYGRHFSYSIWEQKQLTAAIQHPV